MREAADRLRRGAEIQEKLTRVFYAPNAEADQLIMTIPAKELPPDAWRDLWILGQWHAENGRWRDAAIRYKTLTEMNLDDDLISQTFIHAGTAFLEGGDIRGYERLRESMVDRYGRTTNSLVAERVLYVSLLRPANSNLMEALRPLANMTINFDLSTITNFQSAAWRACAFSLWKYRQGDYAAAADWSQKVEAPFSAPARQTILAMSHFGLGKLDLSRAELSDIHNKIEDYFRRPLPFNTWNDQLYTRILIREAQALIDGVTETNAVTK